LDIAEAIVLALVASLLPAVDIRQRSGLDTGRTCTGQSGKLRVQAERAATAANQERLYNASTVVEWLKAETGRKETKHSLLGALPSRVSSRIRAWKTTDPLNHPDAPAGPQLMSEYRSSKEEQAVSLSDQASEVFEQGTQARQHSDEYVRVTVTLATVLLLLAISQRFKTRGVRLGLLVVAALLLCFPLYRILTLPRA